MKLKQCPDCAKNGEGPKPLSDFNKCSRWPDGKQYVCREHQRARLRKHYKKSGAKYNEQKKVWRANNKVAARAIDTRKNMKLKYGVTETQYRQMFDSQNGGCAVCDKKLVNQFDTQRDFGIAPENLARVDHCHLSGAVRGLLCFNCNIGLGKFQDDIETLLAAARYLQETAAVKVASRQGDVKPDCEIEPRRAGPRIERECRENRLDELNPFI